MLTQQPYDWDDPSTPLTVPNAAGRAALVDVRDIDGGASLFGFHADHKVPGELTVRWTGFLVRADLGEEPVPAPVGPLTVRVVGRVTET